MRSADSTPGRQRGEDRVEPLDGAVGAADHQAVAALEAEDAAAGAAVDVVDPLLADLGGAADVVAVVGVAAVDDRVAGLEHGGHVLDRLLGDLAGRDHHPDRARRAQLRGQLLQRGGALGALAGQLGDRVGVDVVGDDLVAVAHQPARHVGAHPAEADDSQLHRTTLPLVALQDRWAQPRRCARRWIAWREPMASGQGYATADEAADVLAIFGISGDLAKKMTFRALYRLEARGKLDCPIVGVAIDDGTTSSCASTPANRSPRPSATPTRTSSPASPARLSYVQGDYADADTFERVGEALGDAKHPVFYLEIPPSLFATVVERPRRGRADRERPRRDREALRPRPRLGAGAQRRTARGAATRSRSSASTITSARSR